MVYGGKPSRGCQTCKNRKIKCDETRPFCLKCQKSSRACLGYKDEADLIFRDENDRIRAKARKSRNPASSNSSPSYSNAIQSTSTLQVSRTRASQLSRSVVSHTNASHFYGTVPSLHPPPSLPIEEQIVLVYFKNFYTLYQNDESVRGFLPYLVPMYQQSQNGSPLRAATRAAALCAISQLPGQRQLTYQATATYGKAIMAVAVALQDPVQARSDETLQTILLLCLYESIKASDRSIKAWSNHVDGAAALVCARGTEQFSNSQSVSLFRAARTQMLTNCIRREVAPPKFPGEKGWLGDMMFEKDTTEELTRCALELPFLLEEAKPLLRQERKPDTLKAMSELIEKAYTLQNRIANILPNLDMKYQPRTVAYVAEEPTEPGSAEAWLGPIFEYFDIHVAGVVVKLRSCCMFATWIVMDCIKWLVPDSFTNDGRWQHSAYVERTTIDDICSSVPFHLSWKPEAKAKLPDQMETIADIIGGFSLVWPLAAAAHSPRLSLNQKAWIWGRLRKIAHDYGLEQASLLESNIKDTLDSFLNRPLY